MRHARKGTWLLFLLFVCGAGQPAAAEEPAEWTKLRESYQRLFVRLPVARMFAKSLDAELKLNRRDPYTKSHQEDLARDRDAIKLRRAQIVESRRGRAILIPTLEAARHEKAPATLLAAYARVRADVDLATKVRKEYAKALTIDINPGVDPGGLYWKRWAGKESSAARSILAEEEKLLALILAAIGRRDEPEVRTWLRTKAAKDPSPTIRMQMMETLAKGTDPGATVVLRALLAGERQTWARVAIIHALAAGKPPGAAAAVLHALADKAWPVRAAALTALRTLDARNATVVEALLAALELASGRLRLDLRDALVWSTGRTLGLDAGEWRTWWEAHKADWVPLKKAAPLAPIGGDGVSYCFGVPTTSKRIVFIVNRSAGMRTPVTRRAKGDDGKPSPEPRVDTALNVAAWELGEALASLPKDAEFTVFTMEAEPALWSKKLKKVSKDARTKAVRFLSRMKAEGRSSLHAALDRALRIGQAKSLANVAYGTEAGVDTIILVGGGALPKTSLSARLRQVAVHTVTLADLAGK